MVPIQELWRRVTALQQYLSEKEVDGALIVQRADTLYFSGTAQNTHVYIPGEGKPVVFAYRDVERSRRESPWDVVPMKGISSLPELIQNSGLPLPKVMGMEWDILPVALFERYKKAFPNSRCLDVSYAVRMIRAVKSDWELKRMEEGGDIYRTLLGELPAILKPGMSEIELEGLLELKGRMLGHESLIRIRGFNSEFHFGGVLAGARAAIPGYFDGPIVGLGSSYTHPIGPSHARISGGEPVIIDLAIMKEGYLIDQTRTAVLGELSASLQAAYETAVFIEEKIRKAMVPGRITGDIYREILSFVEKETPYKDYFMGWGENRVKFIGHGIGIELDELPVISRGAKEILQPGMTLAVEPKFVFPQIGAVGIEDTMVVESQEGARKLCSISSKIISIGVS